MTVDVDQSQVSDGPAPDDAARVEKRRAFANVPVSDYVTDVVAAVLLLVSLSLPWTAQDGVVQNAGDITWVLPVTLLSLLTLALPYLARFGLLPSSWTVHTTRRVRLLASLPYALAVLVHLVLDGADLAGFRGIGTAAALGLAGAVLAATPRRCELGPVHTDRSAPSLWWKIAIGLVALMGTLALVWLALYSIDFFKQSPISGSEVKSYILVVVEVLAVVFLCIAPALLAVVRRSFAWRNVAITLGVVVAVIYFIGDELQVALETLRPGARLNDVLATVQPSSEFDDLLETLEPAQAVFGVSTGAGLVLIPALAAVLASPAVVRALKQQHEVTNWLTTANAALRYVAITAGVLIILAVIALVDGLGLAAGITAGVLLLIALVLALVADKTMLRNVGEGRSRALLAAGVTFVLGICLLITTPVAARVGWLGSAETLTWAYAVFTFGLPILIVIALVGPASVRGFFAANAPTKRVQNAGAYEWQEPAAPAPTAAGQTPAMQASPVQAGHAPQGQSGAQNYGAPAAQQSYAAPQVQQPAAAESQQTDSPDPVHAPQDYSAPEVQGTPPTSEPVEPEQPQAPQVSSHSDQNVGSEPTHPSDGAGSSQHTQATAVTDRLDIRDINSGFTPQVAADPQTPAAVLAQIVEDAPQLRPEVASNPTTYPALLEWLGELGDPAVDEALRARK